MKTEFTIQNATVSEAPEIAIMVGELLAEIMETIGIQVFSFILPKLSEGSLSFSVVKNTSFSLLVMLITSLPDSAPSMKVMPSLAFYHREGFSITGGRKLKIALRWPVGVDA